MKKKKHQYLSKIFLANHLFYFRGPNLDCGPPIADPNSKPIAIKYDSEFSASRDNLKEQQLEKVLKIPHFNLWV